jgi:hypothetical protein
MAILQQQGSDVRIQEINLSQVITSASSSVACQVVVSNQGSPDPKYFTNSDDYLNEYGNPNAQISFDVYCGLDFFKEGNAMWARRAVHSDALYAGVVLYSDGTESALNSAPVGIPNPLLPNWGVLMPNTADTPIALFYPIHGQGSYAKSIAVEIVSNNVDTPTNPLAVSATTGGVLPPATYQYQVAALGQNGETLATAPVVVVIAGVSVTNSITISWDLVPLAIGYVVYGRDSVTVGELMTVGQGVLSFIDTGAITPDTTHTPITSPADLPPRNPQFTVNVYDTSQSSYQPVESFLCTLDDGIDSTGTATELEERINPFSNYVQVLNNTPALSSTPTINSSAPKLMTGGDSGTAPTSFDVAAAYGIFANKQLYKINTLINGGHADPIVQLAMDTLAQGRGDTVAMLDVPSNAQQFQQAINYRNLTLNLNSTYSGLFNPDVLEADNINGKQQYVPFSGWAAALCARTDRVANPSFSIAGLNRGIVDVLKTRYTFDDPQSTALFQAQVNYTRTFIGQGIALWEQTTLAAQPSALSWISVRRIVNVIKTSLYSFLLYSLQEPDDEFTGRQIVGSCSAYLQLIQNARGISSFKVVSDNSNNSAAQLNSGIRVVTVVIVPVIPIHEIQLQMVISKQGVSFNEVLQQVNGQPS